MDGNSKDELHHLDCTLDNPMPYMPQHRLDCVRLLPIVDTLLTGANEHPP